MPKISKKGAFVQSIPQNNPVDFLPNASHLDTDIGIVDNSFGKSKSLTFDNRNKTVNFE